MGGLSDAEARRSHLGDCGLCRKRQFVGETWSRLTATDLLDNSGPVLNCAATEDIRPRRRWPGSLLLWSLGPNSPPPNDDNNNNNNNSKQQRRRENKKVKDGLKDLLVWIMDIVLSAPIQVS